VKSPKLYFYDTGVACSLLGIRDKEQVAFHFMKGSLFENLVLNEFIKRNFNQGENHFPFYWQDNHGKEIDCILENGSRVTAVEIKAGKTISASYFENLQYWRSLAELSEDRESVIFGGDQSMRSHLGLLISWKDLNQIEA
jgi:hypothetical protein